MFFPIHLIFHSIIIHLSKVRVCQRLLCSDPLVRVNLQHLLQEVDGHWVGALKHPVEILLLHFWKWVDVVLCLWRTYLFIFATYIFIIHVWGDQKFLFTPPTSTLDILSMVSWVGVPHRARMRVSWSMSENIWKCTKKYFNDLVLSSNTFYHQKICNFLIKFLKLSQNICTHDQCPGRESCQWASRPWCNQPTINQLKPGEGIIIGKQNLAVLVLFVVVSHTIVLCRMDKRCRIQKKNKMSQWM